MSATSTHVSDGSDGTTSQQYLTFRVSDLDVAVPLREVQEIVEYAKVAVAPGAPNYVRGVTQVRGKLLPVIDMSIKLGRQPLPPTARACIVVVDVALDDLDVQVGLVADAVSTLVDIDPAAIEAPPLFGAGVEVAFLQGYVRHQDAMLPLIDVFKVFSNEELLRAARAEQQARAKNEQARANASNDVLIQRAPGAPSVGADEQPSTPKVEMEIWDD